MNLVRCAHNYYRNDGMAPFGQINACGGELINPPK